MLMTKFSTIISALKGEFLKALINCKLIRADYGIENNIPGYKKIVVSLTSYGRRVDKVVYFTLISLLRQSHKPNQIILWLDKDNWNESNIPFRLKSLREKGVEIKFCEDIKSFKKLIPTLKTNPDDYIITVDDDQYYPRDFIKNMVEEIKSDPNNIYAYDVHRLTFSNSKINTYKQWEMDADDDTDGIVMGVGAGGIVYQSRLLHKDIDDADKFMSLAPQADDLWFFFMEYLAGTKCKLIHSKKKHIPLDAFYQKLHQGSSLRDANWNENMNDIQLRRIMEYYDIIDKDLIQA